MGKINVLDKSIAELIAAGEVVERPASVIKELLENSIDAGATAITVEIKNGGVKYIRIADNGSGISKEDVPKAFLRHATSKVVKADDLESIATLGFRGEALASVCAVSKVQLLTKQPDEEIGTLYEICAGEQILYEDAGCPNGTTIIVRDLFYNVPARMKFLKKDVAEGNAIANILDKLALSHSEISFTFIREGKQVLKTSGDGNLKSAIYSVYGKEFVSKLIPVDYSLNGVSVNGYITKPEFARPNRNMQNFFINGRFVKSLTAAKALEEAFKGSIMVGKIPSCVLHINLPFETIDVNVHPAKTEVRFINERPVFDAVYHGTKTALLKGDSVKEISLNPADVIPHKKPDIFSFEQSPYAVKQESAQQLNFGNVNIQKKTILDTNFKTTDKSKKNINDFDEPQLFIPKTKPFVHTETPSVNLFSNSIVRDSVIKSNAENSIFNNNFNHTSDSNNNQIFNIKTEDDETDNIIKEIKTDEIFTSENNKSIGVIDCDTEDNVVPVISCNDKLTDDLDNIQTKKYVEKSISVNEFEKINADTFEEKEELKYLGEAFATYILVQKGSDKIMFIDKHAAHERIIYEKLLKEKGKGFMQCLLVPVIVTLPKDEYNAVIENLDKLAEYNFDIDDFGNGKIAIRGVPQYIDKCSIEDMIAEIANNLLEKKKDINTEQMDWLFHSISCRSAIKAGNVNYERELMEIAKIVDTDDDIRYCPHGRPVCFVLTKRELEKQFGRV